VQRISALHPDALVVAAYGLLLPPLLLEAGRYGALNIHASLLPRWRGAAPIQRALLSGDRETGISIMQMDQGLDTGPVLQQKSIPITDEDDAGTLQARLAELGATMIIECLEQLAEGRARPVPQPASGATYARKIGKRETRLDWSRPAVELERAVRAFRPTPGAMSTLAGEPIKIWRSRVVQQRLAPGALGDNLVIGCGQDALQVTELQRPGGKRLDAQQFLRGRALAPGTRFE
jgi:methionyl-tRNA formyltransferase